MIEVLECRVQFLIKVVQWPSFVSLTCCSQSLVLVILTGKLMRKLFFGQLRAAEFEHLMERSWYAVTETCLAFTVFK